MSSERVAQYEQEQELERLRASPDIHSTDPAEEEFLKALRARPNDDETRLVYADWLEERSRLAECSFLRFQTKLRTMKPDDEHFHFVGAQFRSMAELLDARWRALVAYAPIEKCKVRFDFACPKQWESLEPSGKGDKIRHCSACKMNVYYSVTFEEANAHARKGRCVVVDVIRYRVPGDLEKNEADRVRYAGGGEETIRMGGMIVEDEPEPEPEKPSLLGRLKSLFTR